jgi:hypothetical protein
MVACKLHRCELASPSQSQVDKNSRQVTSHTGGNLFLRQHYPAILKFPSGQRRIKITPPDSHVMRDTCENADRVELDM